MEDSISDHVDYAAWITHLATEPEPFALSVLVLSGFIRVVTNPRVVDPPSTLDQSFAFVSALVERPTARIVDPGPDHWDDGTAHAKLKNWIANFAAREFPVMNEIIVGCLQEINAEKQTS